MGTVDSLQPDIDSVIINMYVLVGSRHLYILTTQGEIYIILNIRGKKPTSYFSFFFVIATVAGFEPGIIIWFVTRAFMAEKESNLPRICMAGEKISYFHFSSNYVCTEYSTPHNLISILYISYNPSSLSVCPSIIFFVSMCKLASIRIYIWYFHPTGQFGNLHIIWP